MSNLPLLLTTINAKPQILSYHLTMKLFFTDIECINLNEFKDNVLGYIASFVVGKLTSIKCKCRNCKDALRSPTK